MRNALSYILPMRGVALDVELTIWITSHLFAIIIMCSLGATATMLLQIAILSYTVEKFVATVSCDGRWKLIKKQSLTSIHFGFPLARLSAAIGFLLIFNRGNVTN